MVLKTQSMLFGQSSAEMSEDGAYRYALRRVWDASIPSVMFVGYNPSTADAETDDPTIRRCIRFARTWGYGGLLMGNLFARHATDPQALNEHLEGVWNPIGEFVGWNQPNRNDEWLVRLASEAAVVVAAWGAITMPKGYENRPSQVRRLLPNLHALGLTQAGHPRHPLYVKADARLVPMRRHEHDWSEWVMYEGSQERRSCQTCGAVQWD